MSSATYSPDTPIAGADQRRRAVWIIVCCTLICAAAQVLIKQGANQLGHTDLLATLLGIFTIPSLFTGYFLYAIFTAMMVYALRIGELSILYPVIALTYVWVTILSVVIFHEALNPLKGFGVALIVSGVAVLGRGGMR